MGGQNRVQKVRIGIVSRNRSAILPRAIESALAQDYPHKEVVVLDDGSTDGTRDLAAHFPDVRWIFRDQPGGYMTARNQLMQEPGADCYASLDDDSWFLEMDAISRGVETLRVRKAAAVGYDILDDRQRQKHVRTGAVKVNSFIGCGHLLDLDAVREAGWYASMPGAYGGEENDLSLRLLNLGREVLLLPGVHVWHDKTMQTRDLAGQRRSVVVNDLLSVLLRCPAARLPMVLPGKALNHLLFTFRFAMAEDATRDAFDRAIVQSSGRWCFVKPTLLGIFDALRHAAGAWKQRVPLRSDVWKEVLARRRHTTPLEPEPGAVISSLP